MPATEPGSMRQDLDCSLINHSIALSYRSCGCFTAGIIYNHFTGVIQSAKINFYLSTLCSIILKNI